MGASHIAERPRVLVTGATGTTGSRVQRALVREGHEVLAVSRSTAIPFDWTDAATHAAAVDGVTSAYLLPPVGVPDPEPLMRPFIELALEAGVRRFVLLSASIIPEGGPGAGQVHALLRRVAPEWAVLQPSWFMQNFAQRGYYLAEDLVDGHRLRTSIEDGRVAFVDADDIAAVAVRALVDPEPPQTGLVITGPEALSYDNIAEVFSGLLGHTVVHERVDARTVAAVLVDSGVPPDFAEILAGMESGLRAGAEDRTTETVERWTGRPPRSFADWARANTAVWS